MDFGLGFIVGVLYAFLIVILRKFDKRCPACNSDAPRMYNCHVCQAFSYAYHGKAASGVRRTRWRLRHSGRIPAPRFRKVWER